MRKGLKRFYYKKIKFENQNQFISQIKINASVLSVSLMQSHLASIRSKNSSSQKITPTQKEGENSQNGPIHAKNHLKSLAPSSSNKSIHVNSVEGGGKLLTQNVEKGLFESRQVADSQLTHSEKSQHSPGLSNGRRQSAGLSKYGASPFSKFSSFNLTGSPSNSRRNSRGSKGSQSGQKRARKASEAYSPELPRIEEYDPNEAGLRLGRTASGNQEAYRGLKRSQSVPKQSRFLLDENGRRGTFDAKMSEFSPEKVYGEHEESKEVLTESPPPESAVLVSKKQFNDMKAFGGKEASEGFTLKVQTTPMNRGVDLRGFGGLGGRGRVGRGGLGLGSQGHSLGTESVNGVSETSLGFGSSKDLSKSSVKN